MAEYIDKQRAKDLMGCCLASAKAEYKAAKGIFEKEKFWDYISTIQAMIDVVGATEAADVQPVKHGRWIKVQDKQGDYFLCSNCGTAEKTESEPDGAVWWHDEYCRKCGVRMDGDK